jgi:hypothetical protein
VRNEAKTFANELASCNEEVLQWSSIGASGASDLRRPGGSREYPAGFRTSNLSGPIHCKEEYMPSIYLKIRGSVERLEEAFISGRIRTILNGTNATSAEVSGSMWHDYTISSIPNDAVDSVFYEMERERGFEPTRY